jgi:hypothetical protein
MRPGPEEVPARLSQRASSGPHKPLGAGVHDEGFTERLRLLHEHLAEEEVDEIVRWQMTGVLIRKAPVVRHQEQPRCHRCYGDWHGLPREDCPGSFDTPNKDK